MTEKNSPLDMKPTIDWYKAQSQEIYRRIHQALKTSSGNYTPRIKNGGAGVGISKDYIRRLTRTIPQEALERSILERILLKDALWFDKTSEIKQNPTPNINEAFSPTAIIPSYTSYAEWIKTGTPAADIELYKISPSLAGGRDIVRIILTEGLIHELGHTIIAPSQYTDQKLILPDGKLVTGEEAMKRFAELAEKQEPISHYAEEFRNSDKTFIDTKQKTRATSVSEELAESIAAYILGFAYSEDKKRRLSPFADRPEIKQFVQDFLHARKGE